MKILFAARSFDNIAGGVERIAISIMNEMIRRGHEVSLVTWDYKEAVAFYPISKKVNWFKINLGEPLGKASWSVRIKRAFLIRKMIRDTRPDLILAFQHGIFFSLKVYTLGMGITFIAAERNAISIYQFTSVGKYKNLIMQTFRLADYITVQLPGYLKEYPKYLQEKIYVIPNRVEQINLDVLPKPNKKSRKNLLSVGRLSFQKNYKLLIDVFAGLSSEFDEWDLVIAGGGEEFSDLSEQIKHLKLGNRVLLLGSVVDVESLYLNADLFCLPSLWEGFPNSLAEALSYGLPSIGFSESSGVNGLIANDYNGLLANGNSKPESLRSSLKALMESSELREFMSANAINSMKQFQPKKIYDQWEELFNKAAH
jgi:glycosyltransferase involved in cell wall biosynthesis